MSFPLLLFLMLPFGCVRSQDDSAYNLSVLVQHHFGSFITNAPKATYVRDSYSSFTEIALMKQTDGHQFWHRANNYPSAGLGLAFGNTGSREYVGRVVSLYPFVSFPLLRGRAITTLFRLGTGISAVEKPYDVRTNHKNTIIGSRFNNYIHLSLDNEVKLSRPLSLRAALTFAHISNGNIKLPNYGLNFLMLSAGFRYSFGEIVTRDTAKTRSIKEKGFRLFLSAGAKQTPWIRSPRYVVGVVTGEYLIRASAAGTFGGGVDLFLDPSLTKDPSGFTKDRQLVKNVQAGLHGFYERVVGRVTIPIQAGIYVLHAESTKRFYQSVGVRYAIRPKLDLFYHLKTHGGKADFLHAGVGYTF